VQGRSRWEPELAALYPAIAARFIYNNIRSNVAWLNLLLPRILQFLEICLIRSSKWSRCFLGEPRHMRLPWSTLAHLSCVRRDWAEVSSCRPDCCSTPSKLQGFGNQRLQNITPTQSCAIIIIINNHNQCPPYTYNTSLNSANYCLKSTNYYLVVVFEFKTLQ